MHSKNYLHYVARGILTAGMLAATAAAGWAATATAYILVGTNHETRDPYYAGTKTCDYGIYSNVTYDVTLTADPVYLATAPANTHLYTVYAKNSGLLSINSSGSVTLSGDTSETSGQVLTVYTCGTGGVSINGSSVSLSAITSGSSSYGTWSAYASSSSLSISADDSVSISAEGNYSYAVYASSSDVTIDSGDSVNITATGTSQAFAVALYGDSDTSTTETLTIDGQTINITATSENGSARGVQTTSDGDIVLGSAESSSVITVTAEGASAVLGITNIAGGTVEINGSSLTVIANVTSDDSYAYGIHVANNSTTETEDLATTIINTDTTTVTSNYAALVAMSQGVLIIDSDLTATGDDVIVTRGGATITINESGEHTTVLEGDINFNYSYTTSRTSVDANVYINLTGEESYWTGNTKKSWDGDTNGILDEDTMSVDSLTIELNDGATWNVTAVESEGEIGTDSSGVLYTALNNLVMNDGNISFEDTGVEIEIESLTGTGGTITTDSLDNSVYVSADSVELDTLTVEYTGDEDAADAEVATFTTASLTVTTSLVNDGALIEVDELSFGDDAEFDNSGVTYISFGSLENDTLTLTNSGTLATDADTDLTTLTVAVLDNSSELSVGTLTATESITNSGTLTVTGTLTTDSLTSTDSSTFSIGTLSMGSSGTLTYSTTDSSTIGTLDGGVTLTMSSDAGTLTIGTTTENVSADIYVNSTTAAQVVIGENNGYVSVTGTSVVTDQLDADDLVASMQTIADTVEIGSGTGVKAVVAEEGTIMGETTAVTDNDGNIVPSSISESANTTNVGLSEMASIALISWRSEINDMNKRLGELRNSTAKHGSWFRVVSGEMKYGRENVKHEYTHFEIGYDEKLARDPRWTIGGAFTYTDGDSTFAYGSGDNTNTGVALYGSYLGENGTFLDLIGRFGKIKNEFTASKGVGSGDYKTEGYSFSAEYGKRFGLRDGFWVEPQVELSYGRVSSTSYKTSNGANVKQNSMDTVLGRVGVALGRNFKQGNFYARGSYLYDFDGETEVTMSKNGISRTYTQDLGSGWWEIGVGANINLGKETYFYFDVEKSYGGNVDTEWEINAGLRWFF